MKESSLFLGLLARRCIKGFTSSLEMHSCKWLSTQRERQVDADTSTILVKDLEAISCGGGSNWCCQPPLPLAMTCPVFLSKENTFVLLHARLHNYLRRHHQPKTCRWPYPSAREPWHRNLWHVSHHGCGFTIRHLLQPSEGSWGTPSMLKQLKITQGVDAVSHKAWKLW